MKQLYELLTYPLSVVEDPFWDFVILTIMGTISFVIAWNFVGETGIRGKAGSILHWTIRIIVMFILCMLTSLIIKFVVFIYSIPLDTWLAIGIMVFLLIFIIVFLKFTVFSKKEKKEQKIDKQKNRYIVLMKRIINVYYDKRINVLRKEDIIDIGNSCDEYIYSEIEDMLIKENLLTKDNSNNSIIEFRTITFLEKYVKNSMSYIINVLVFIITLITLGVSVLEQFNNGNNGLMLLIVFILVIVLIFRALPKDKL